MAKTRAGFLGILALVLVAGFGLGRLSVKRSVEPETLIPEPNAEKAPEPIIVEPNEIVVLEHGPVGGGGNGGAITNEDVLMLARSLMGFERLQLRLGIQNTADLNGRFQLFESGRLNRVELTDAFRTDFELSAAEFRKLKELFMTVNDELEQLEATKATGSWTEDGSEWVFEIPSFPEQGGVLYDRLSKGLESAIGLKK